MTPGKSVKLRPGRTTIVRLPAGTIQIAIRGLPVGGHIAVRIEGPEGMTIENVRLKNQDAEKGTEQKAAKGVRKT